MGESRRRALELAQVQSVAPEGGKGIQLPLIDGVVVTQLDLACHCLAGIAHFLEASFAKPEVAAEVQKSIDHLQMCKARYVRALQSKVIIAQPGDVPKVTQ